MFRKQLEILTIGDITADAFIRLKDPHVHAEINHDAKELCMGFGDKIPFEYVKVIKATGNAANAAVAASRLGLKTAIVTNVGDDQNGKDCFVELQRQNVITTFVRSQKFKPTNYHFVLWYGTDRTILVNHTEFDYKLPEAMKKNSGGLPPKWIYMTSLANNSFPYQMEIADYLEANPNVKLAFQPGTYQIKLGPEKIERLYKRADVCIMNLDEANRVLELYNHSGKNIQNNLSKEDKLENIKRILNGLMRLGPKIVAVTDGVDGAYMFDGDHYYHMPIYPDPRPAFERTGCGDAWSATFTAALAKGLTPLEALTWAPINAMAVAQFVGSQEGLLSVEQLQWWLNRAPEEYRPKEF